MYRYFSVSKKLFRKFSIMDTPICSNCLYFIDSYYRRNRCRKFGKLYLITGAIEYDFAEDCRRDVHKCGKVGLEYREKIKSFPEVVNKIE